MKRIAVVMASILVVACTSTAKNDLAQAPQTHEDNSAAIAAAMQLKTLTAEVEQLQKQSDYFDFNKFAIKPAYEDVIKKEAEFIKAHNQDVVTLEGNADERGSEQYNHSLGNNRAEAVAKEMEKLGVQSSQIKVVSLGKDKPRLLCHKEKCWKENRRVDFMHHLG